jgi:hypothetical protein
VATDTRIAKKKGPNMAGRCWAFVNMRPSFMNMRPNLLVMPCWAALFAQIKTGRAESRYSCCRQFGLLDIPHPSQNVTSTMFQT